MPKSQSLHRVPKPEDTPGSPLCFCAVLGVLSLLCTLACSGPSGAPVAAFAPDACESCHLGAADAGAPKVPGPCLPGHDLACADCHLPPAPAAGSAFTHEDVARHPASLARAPQHCGGCHQAEIQALSRSLHATMAGIINQTRHLWGAQQAAFPPRFGAVSARGALEPLPSPSPTALLEPSPAVLVDDLLRRRCLRCHIDAAPPPEAANSTALQRGVGCAACHAPHPAPEDNGRIPDERCLACHNNNHAGADAHGLFMRDTDDWFQKAVINGRQVPAPYGSAQIRLARGVHTRRGLWCVDCHDSRDVMGRHAASDGVEGFASQRTGVTCAGCHGGWGPAAAPKGRLRQRDGLRLLAAADGRELTVPPFTRDHAAHDPAAHADLRCDACHGLWSFQDYGLELAYQEGGAYNVWHYLTRQGDPFVENALLRAMDAQKRGDASFTPQTPDHLSGELRPGLWQAGWRFRRWSPMPLGRDHLGRVAVLRPRHQYRVSAVDHRGVCVLDGAIPRRGGGGRGWAFMPQTLHAIGERGRPCGACHGSAEAAGLGSDLAALQPLAPGEGRVRDLALTTPQPPALPGMALLDMAEAEALLSPPREVRRRIFAQRRPWLALPETSAKETLP